MSKKDYGKVWLRKKKTKKKKKKGNLPSLRALSPTSRRIDPSSE